MGESGPDNGARWIVSGLLLVVAIALVATLSSSPTVPAPGARPDPESSSRKERSELPSPPGTTISFPGSIEGRVLLAGEGCLHGPPVYG